jgi:adenosylhomocysteine nucleosidase
MGARGLPDFDSARNHSLNPTGVVAALAAEARTLGPQTRRSDGLVLIGDGLLVAVNGIGTAAATLAARSLVEAGATALISWGMAGGLDPKLRAGTVCLPNEVISKDGASYFTTPHWRELLRAAAATAASLPVIGGKLLTSAHIIDAVAGKACAFRETGAAAVDMESLAVAQVAAAHGLPFIAVRAIVDCAADELPGSVLAASRAGQVQIRQLIRGLARSPFDVAALVRLARRYRAATRSLRAVARTGALVPRPRLAVHGARIA